MKNLLAASQPVFIMIFLILIWTGNSPIFAQKLHGNLANTNYYDTKDLQKLTGIKWMFNTSGRIFSSPVIRDSVLFCGSADSHLYAIDINIGEEIWRFKTDGAVNSTPAIANDLAYFGSMDGNFYAIHIKNGTMKWQFATRGEKKADIWDYFLSSPAVFNGLAYFGSGDGHLYAMDASNGKMKWSFETGGIVHSSPALDDSTIYFGSFDGYFYALDLQTGDLKWKFKTVGDRWFPEGAIQCGGAVSDGIVYFGSRDYNIYALNTQTGTGMLNMKEPFSWIIPAPAIKDTALYFGTSDSHNFYALDKHYGVVLWKTEVGLNVFGSCSIGQKLGYFDALHDKLFAINLQSGEIVWTFQTEAHTRNYHQFFDPEGT